MVLQILQIIVAVFTILIGAMALIQPNRITIFIGLDPMGPRGITELRSIFGGAFIALGAVPLIFGTPETYQMLGIMYLTIGVIRVVSMLLDRSVMLSNTLSVISEFVFGIILVL